MNSGERHARVLHPFVPTFQDYPDEVSCAVEVFMAGCDNSCPKCQNPELRSRRAQGSLDVTVDQLIGLVREASRRFRTRKVVLVGGDPLSRYNVEFTREFLVRTERLFDVCVYTGKSPEYVKRHDISGFAYLKCGCYDDSYAQVSGKIRGTFRLASQNQDIFDRNFRRLTEHGVMKTVEV